MKKIVILSQGPNNGELANQLWNYASIYAYILEKSSLEKGTAIKFINNSFYEYGDFFANLAGDRTAFADTFFFRPFTGRTERKFSSKKQWYRRLYRIYSALPFLFHKKNIVSSILISKKSKEFRNRAYLLPPSVEVDPDPAKKDAAAAYFYGWLFRNPAGLEKYRAQIHEHFAPAKQIADSTRQYVANIRTSYKQVIGVHIRQGDYQTWQNGVYFIEQARVRQILNEYLSFRKLNTTETCFIITSDGAVDTNAFAGLNISVTGKNMVEDLFILAQTDEIIGSDSTFGAFASYYGNIPHIVMRKDPIDWEYYRDKKSFFENKYLNWVYFR